MADVLSTLIRFDTSTPGGDERPAAEWVAARLAEVGVRAEIFESEPGRASLVARIPGADPLRGALLMHGHLDVVPADPAEWQVHPFAGEIRDGCVWGRGAVDMKNAIAMLLTVVAIWHREGYVPPRDVVLAFTADEEAGGDLGARYLVDHHRDLLADCTEAVGEVGGFSVTLPEGGRLYPIQTAEKGALWLRLVADGTPGHGSLVNPDNAVTRLSGVMNRLGERRFPAALRPQTRVLLETLARLRRGESFDPRQPERDLAGLGGFGRLLEATLRTTLTPTSLRAGSGANTVPPSAQGTIDVRYLPGERESALAAVDEILGDDVVREMLLDHVTLDSPYDAALPGAMAAALLAEDPAGHPVPFTLSGGTDAKSFYRLGELRCYGFSPLRLPAGLDFVAMFHGVNERVPVDALEFGVRVLDRFLRSS
ncbi:M20/M25/M40 family metallo-hydrolase [Kineosporia corallincola]|uniref:M20/M25/M40 family metallo-hydrolase n=1 Tax=Kineosporia corallincola TaxID=2835133 RepID=UPI0035571E74